MQLAVKSDGCQSVIEMKTNMKCIIIIGILTAVFLTAASAVSAEYQTIQPAELKSMLQQKDFFLLDVHVPEQSHIPGTDAFIDYRQIRQNIRKLPADKHTQIVVYCLGGGMSRAAARVLNELGYTRVYDLAGGTRAYRRLPD